MSISIAPYEMMDAANTRQISDSMANREVNIVRPTNEDFREEIVKKEHRELQEKIHDEVMMDSKEVKDFLFMLIGANLKLKGNNNAAGKLINKLA